MTSQLLQRQELSQNNVDDYGLRVEKAIAWMLLPVFNAGNLTLSLLITHVLYDIFLCFPFSSTSSLAPRRRQLYDKKLFGLFCTLFSLTTTEFRWVGPKLDQLLHGTSSLLMLYIPVELNSVKLKNFCLIKSYKNICTVTSYQR